MSLLQMSLAEYLAAITTDGPGPGSGSTASLAGALGCATALRIVHVVASAADAPPELTQIEEILTASLDEFAMRVDTDAEAYSQFRENLKPQAGTAAQRAMRGAKLRMAVEDTVRVPLEVAGQAVNAMAVLDPLAAMCGPQTLIGVGIASSLLRTCFESAKFVAQSNMRMVNDPEVTASLMENLDKYSKLCDKVYRRIAKTVTTGLRQHETA